MVDRFVDIGGLFTITFKPFFFIIGKPKDISNAYNSK